MNEEDGVKPPPLSTQYSALSTSLRFDSVSKSFPGVQALADVSFAVRGGSVHALLGENGAGKSTLLKILSGAHPPTSGTLAIDDRHHVFHSTTQALSAGVAVIYQELHLAPELSVSENIYLGHLPAVGGLVSWGQLHEQSRRLLAMLGEDINPRIRVGRLPIGQRQMVEIAKALTRGARIIAFDEPTSSLSSREIDRLFSVIRDLRGQGRAILYVSHRMDEVYDLCDAATVLRDGRHVRTWESLADVTRQQIIRAMVGRDLADVYGYAPRPIGAALLEVRDVMGPGLKSPASLDVAAGEIVGLFGLVGAGRTELLKLIYGATSLSRGQVVLGGRAVPRGGPRASIVAGLLFCPEDRKKEGIVPMASVRENLNLSARRHHALGGLLLNFGWETSNADRFIGMLGIRTPSPRQLIRNLSGGNQQKVILGRWLGENVRALLLDEPTRGIDVGAKSEIYAIIRKLASRGVAVLFTSSELPEVLGIADRVLVMRQGAISGQLQRAEFSQEAALRLALPVTA